MTPTQRLLKQLELRGLRVEPGAKAGELLLCGPAEQMTPELWAALKAFKADIVAHLGAKSVPPEPAYTPAAESVEVPAEKPAAQPTREGVIAGVFDRAREAGRAVYGFGSGKASCREVTARDFPAEFDRACVEGDPGWTRIPG